MPPVCPEAPPAEGGTHADVLPDLGWGASREAWGESRAPCEEGTLRPLGSSGKAE